MTQRYRPKREHNDTWTVIDAQTERAAEMGSRTIVGMNQQDANELAELLNKLDAHINKEPNLKWAAEAATSASRCNQPPSQY